MPQTTRAATSSNADSTPPNNGEAWPPAMTNWPSSTAAAQSCARSHSGPPIYQTRPRSAPAPRGADGSAASQGLDSSKPSPRDFGAAGRDPGHPGAGMAGHFDSRLGNPGRPVPVGEHAVVAL